MTASTLCSPASAPPRYATARNPQLATFGPHVDAVMTALGHPPMPWQRTVNAVANEVLEDGSFRYKTVIVSTPRQAGKTTTLEGTFGHRGMTMPDFRGFYTAQTGLHARDVWAEWADDFARRMPGRWKFARSAGKETARWPSTGGFIRAFPPTPDSLHSKQSDLVCLDEVWSYTQGDGDAITQAVVPTQATRPRRQLWIVSTAGDEDSVWMRSWIERGRASIADPASEIAYFEWSAPEDAPWDDPETWATYHPAYGYTQSEQAFRDAMVQMGEEQFRRGFLNQWPATEASWRQSWPNGATEDTIPADARVWLAVDSQTNHRTASITAAAQLPDGRIAVEVIDNRPGIDWLKDRLKQLVRTHRARVVIHAGGPLGFLIDELQKDSIRIDKVTGTEYGHACQRFLALVRGGQLAHQNDPRLNLAVDNALLRDTGDTVKWIRKDTTVDITMLVAASLASWKAAEPARKPQAWSGRVSGSPTAP